MKYLERSFSVATGIGEGTKETGRFIWDKAQNKLVRIEDYIPPEHAVNAPILSGRFYEGVTMTDGTRVNSRAEYNAWMKQRGVTAASDFSPQWYANRKAEIVRDEKRERRESIENTYRELKNR